MTHHPLASVALAVAALAVAPVAAHAQEPPFSDTEYLDADIIRPSDPGAFRGAAYEGRARVMVYDARKNKDVRLNAYRFDLRYPEGPVKLRVNPEYSLRKARSLARKYGSTIGRIPRAVRQGIIIVKLSSGKGTEHIATVDTAGENIDLSAESQGMRTVQADGHLEEMLFHEATHAGLDSTIFPSPAWEAAVAADPAFISDYAAENPEREDVAESLLAWFAVRHRPDRISQQVRRTIEATIPSRLALFDTYEFDLTPSPR